MYLKLVNHFNDDIGINEVDNGVFEVIIGNTADCNSIILNNEELNDLIQLFDLFLKKPKHKIINNKKRDNER